MSPARARVAGVLMAKDEWPLLAVTVTALLSRHVDRLIVLNHGSTDGTTNGLARLCARWGDRLDVREVGGVEFHQAALVTMVLLDLAVTDAEWIYVVDADEIALHGERPLGEVLAELPAPVALARYQIDNWVAPRDFATVHLPELVRVRTRAVADPSWATRADQAVDEIASGRLTYYDVPFGSKVIVRNGSSVWLTAGAHFAEDLDATHEVDLDRTQFSVAHLPLLSRDRLARRVAHSRAIVAIGLPATHGWQSHLVASVDSSGELDAFWRRHSVADPDDTTGPRVLVDDTLADTVRATIAQLGDEVAEIEGTAPAPSGVAPSSLATVITSLRRLPVRLLERIGTLERDADAKSAEIAWLRELVRQRERETVADAAVRADLAHQLARAVQTHSELLASRTWKWGRRLRRVARLGRR